MSRGKRRVEENVKLHFREAGKGFIIVKNPEGMLHGRKLAKTYLDQFDRRHVEINGNFELITDSHCYLGVD